MKIAICGSIVFYKEMESVRDTLMGLGHEVKMPQPSLEIPDVEHGDEKSANHGMLDLKEQAMKDHYGIIDWCEAILVVNGQKNGIAGYIGGNTLIEIGAAFYLKKKIFILNPVSSGISYRQEIMAMKPMVLEGDLTKI